MPVQYLSIKGSRDNSKGHSVRLGYLRRGEEEEKGMRLLHQHGHAVHASQQLKAALSVALYCHQTKTIC